MDVSQWGQEFEAPIGEDIGVSYEAFQLTAFFFMAGEDNTKVTKPDGTIKVLKRGEGAMVRVNQGQKLLSDKPIQVDLLTGDVWSNYEVRWYSLRDNKDYVSSYVSPVGDSYGKTKLVIYNPLNVTLTYTVQYLVNNVKTQYAKTLAAKQAALSIVIPTGSGAFIDGSSKFVALSLTDSEFYNGVGYATGGQFYDWGFPLVPRGELTPQVVIGLGYACTNNNCQGQTDRSPVWIT
jgi:hypothetical protein